MDVNRLICLFRGHAYCGWAQDQELVIRVCERCDETERIIVHPFELACSIEGRYTTTTHADPSVTLTNSQTVTA